MLFDIVSEGSLTGKLGFTVEVVSVNVGKPVSIKVQNKELFTGIVKSPISSDLFLCTLITISGLLEFVEQTSYRASGIMP
jgi:hypothetical protein